jgi:hypothetical protein
MEGLVLFALGAGTVLLAQKGRKRAKAALGWLARQSGFIAGRVKSDIATAKQVAHDEFSKAREDNPPPQVDVVVPSTRVTHADGESRANGSS